MYYLFEGYSLDCERRELRRGADFVSVSPQVFDLLAYLIARRDRVVSKDELVSSIWRGRIVSDSAITTRLNIARSSIGDSGAQQRLIKTIARKGFRFVGQVCEASSESADSESHERLSLPHKPSIAVLPFWNDSGEQASDYFADGIAEDIIVELSRFSELFVIARNSSFRYRHNLDDVRRVGRELGVQYVLGGSIRRSGQRARIAVQLVDAATAACCWSERYDRALEDVFGIQDDVTRTVASLLAAHIDKVEAARVLSRAPSSWEAHDYYLRGSEHFYLFLSSFLPSRLYEARRHLEQSLTIDPAYARAWALLSNTYAIAFLQPIDADHANMTAIESAHRMALKAVQLDPHLPIAHAKLGVALGHAGLLEESIAAFERATELNPNFSDWRFVLPLVHSGQFDRALEVASRHLRLDPFPTPGLANVAAYAHYMLKEYDVALRLVRDSIARLPKTLLGHVIRAAACARTGRVEEARTAAAEVIRIAPAYTVDGMQRRLSPFAKAEHAEHFFSGLCEAGLPSASVPQSR